MSLGGDVPNTILDSTVASTELHQYGSPECECHPSQAKFANPYNGAPTTRAAIGVHRSLNPRHPLTHGSGVEASSKASISGHPNPKPHVPYEISLSKGKTSTGLCPPPPNTQGTKNALEMLIVVRVGWLGVQIMLWSYVSELNNFTVIAAWPL